MQNTQHPDDAAVDALATAMKAKLAKQRAKGYGGWDTDCTQQRLSDMLRTHMEKGDPVDVANFCAFLLARGEAIAAAQQAVQADAPLPLLLRDIARDLGITVPQACIALKPLGNYSTNSAVTAEMARMLRDHFPAPAHPAEGVPAQAVGEMTAERAEYFMRRFLHEEKLLGPNEQAALHYVIDLLTTHPAQQGMEQDAARWREVLQHVGAAPHFGGQHFTLNTLQAPDTSLGFKANLMRGSVAQHFTKAIDAALAAQAKQGGV